MFSICCNSHIKLLRNKKRPEKDDWRKFEKNSLTIALSILYAKRKKNILLMFKNTT